MNAPETLTLASLATASFAGPQLGVLGDPIAHSLSPAMHGAALAALLPTHPELAGWRYHRLHITAAELAPALVRLHALGFTGLNLTVPHKIPSLALVESLSPEARRAESVNTLVATATGWAGHTTDGQGFLEALREQTSASVAGRPVVLLGAGGAARAVAAACLDAGCARLTIHNRDAAKAVELAAALADPLAHGAGLDALTALPAAALVVNCTTLGLKADDPSPLGTVALHPGHFVFDTTYAVAPSRLLRDARAAGAEGCDGRSMLRWQGALAFRLWTGILPPAEPMRRALGEITP
ncbi:shikimate dehydrogenase [Verrucomicrobiota bacterium]|nr:shikimate dehydrogenase [Verrucomicrobiota bacterium]